MAKALGNTRKLYITTGSAYNALAGETSSSLNLSADMIDVSDKDVAWKEYIAGYKGGTIDATIFVDESDESQKALLAALHNGTELNCFVGELKSNAPSVGDAFKALVASGKALCA